MSPLLSSLSPRLKGGLGLALGAAAVALLAAGLTHVDLLGPASGAVALALIVTAGLGVPVWGFVGLVGGLFAAIVLLPVRFHILVQVNFLGYQYGLTDLLLLALLLTLGLFLLLQVLRSGRLSASPLDGGLLALAAASFLSFWVNSADPAYSPERYARALVLFFGPMAVFGLLIHLRLKQKTCDWLVSLLIGLACLVSILGILVSTLGLRYMGLLGWSQVYEVLSAEVMRARTPVGGAGSTAIFVGMVLPLVAARLTLARRRLGRLAYGGALLLCLACMLLAQSRAPLAAVAGGVLFLFWPSLRAGRVARWGVVLLFLAAGVTALLATRVGLGRLVTLQEVSGEVRAEAGATALEVWADHPLLGTGMGYLYPREEFSDPSDRLYYKGRPTLFDPHSQLLLTLTEGGLLGIAALLAFLAMIGGSMVANLRQVEGLRPSLLARAFVASVLAYLAYSLLSCSMSVIPKVATTFWFVAGLGWVYLRAVRWPRGRLIEARPAVGRSHIQNP